MIRKNDMSRPRGSRPTRTTTWMWASLCGLPGKAQIGKGMWAAPDRWPT
jgi:malate synthase